jgi:hypothetical protein
MSKPTHQDAQLYIQHLDYLNRIGFEEARAFLWSDDFPIEFEKFEKEIEGTEKGKYPVIYAEALETMGAFFKHGLIHPDLLFDLESFITTWERFEEIIIKIRERDNFPGFLKCFEDMVEAEKEYRS